MQPPDDTLWNAWQAAIKDRSAEEIVRWAWATFPGKVKFASSLGVEDQVLTEMIARVAPQLPIFTLDTGRLFPKTYALIEETRKQYGVPIAILFPDAAEVEAMVGEHGVNLFYSSIELRKHCCAVRKLHPLKRALAGLDAWMVGLRREQSVAREALAPLEWDAANGLVKISPLWDWSEAEVWDYARSHAVPYHPLHDQGFRSIGCAPCTRAVLPGEDTRAGRWWWEQPEHRECGLHVGSSLNQEGKGEVSPLNKGGKGGL